MFYDNLKMVCNKQGIAISRAVVEAGGKVGSIDGWKKGASPNSDIVAKLAVRLNVSADFLIFGKEKDVQSEQLTADEQELLAYYKSLNDNEKGIILGEAKAYSRLNK